MFSRCEVRCSICLRPFDWMKGYGREHRCCGAACYQEFGWRRALSILGKNYYPDPQREGDQVPAGFKIADVRPLGNRVLIKRDPEETTYGSGLIARPDTHRGRRQTGTVVKVGPGVLNPRTGEYTPPEVKVGDRVWFVPWHNEEVEGATEVSQEEREYTLVPADYIAAIIPPEPEK